MRNLKSCYDRAIKERSSNAISPQDFDIARYSYEIALVDVEIAKAVFAERKHDLAIAVLQEKFHSGQKIDVNELAGEYSKRWEARKQEATLGVDRSEKDIKRQDAQFTRARN